LIRWTLIAILSIVPALIAGWMFVMSPYGGRGMRGHERTERMLKTDTMPWLTLRFCAGAAIGGIGSFWLIARATRDKR